MSVEHWRWPEFRWVNEDIDWRNAEVISAGVDIGSVSSKVVILVDGKLYAYDYMRTGYSSPDSAEKAMNWVLELTDMTLKDIHFIIGTGYGRVNVPYSNMTITEIACHARGAVEIYGPSVRTILDMGGQDLKVIRCNEKGKVLSFLMNDKCAAGTGRGLEVFADLMNIPIQELGKVSLSVDKEPPPVSYTCVVFARSECIGLLREGWPKEKVAAAYHIAMVNRMIELLQRLGVERELVVTGGVTKNPGIIKRLERNLGLKTLSPKPGMDPALAGAMGAALFAKAYYERKILGKGA